MSLVKFTKTPTKDPDLNVVQDLLVRSLNPLFSQSLLDGVLLVKVQLQTGTNSINHKLGRNLIGWILTRQRSLADVYDTQDTNKTPASTLNLVSSAPMLADIYVF